MTHPYRVLGVERDSTPAEIKVAYKKLARATHPDLHGGDKQKERRFKDVSAAYELLSDAAKRADYDRCTSQSQPSGASETASGASAAASEPSGATYPPRSAPDASNPPSSTPPPWEPSTPASFEDIDLASIFAVLLGALGFLGAAAFFKDVSERRPEWDSRAQRRRGSDGRFAPS